MSPAAAVGQNRRDQDLGEELKIGEMFGQTTLCKVTFNVKHLVKHDVETWLKSCKIIVIVIVVVVVVVGGGGGGGGGIQNIYITEHEFHISS